MSRERRLGEALKAVVSEAYDAEDVGARGSVLMNANRRRVFEYLAWRPVCSVADVARALGVSEPTVVWHIRKLVEAGYVAGPLHARPARYWAAGMGLVDSEVAALAALADPTSTRVLVATMAVPGLTGKQLAGKIGEPGVRRAMRDLLSADLIVAVADGRYRRYFPGKAAFALEKNAPKHLREFRRRLLRRLEADRLSPEIRMAPGDAIEIDMRFGGDEVTMRLPATSLLAGRLG